MLAYNTECQLGHELSSFMDQTTRKWFSFANNCELVLCKCLTEFVDAIAHDGRGHQHAL